MPHLAPPWYRQFWPWVLIGLPASAVIASLITVWIALDNPDPLVHDDYYRAGLAIQKDLSRLERARALQVRGQLRMQADGLSIELHGASPSHVELRWLHPTDQSADRTLQVHAQSPGQYRLTMPPLPPGRWQVRVDADDWRLGARLLLPDVSTVDLLPSAN